MCFSAPASFTVSAVLGAVGCVTLAKAPKKLWMLSVIPLVFSFQQACEGLVWITLNQGDTTSLLHNVVAYTYLYIASGFWPLWIPLSFYSIEKNKTRKRLLFGTLLGGIVVSFLCVMGFYLLGKEAQIVDHHLSYPYSRHSYGILSSQVIDYLEQTGLIIYPLVTVMAPFLSSLKFSWIFGFLVGLGWILAMVFYHFSFGSIWCFFAALSSLVTYFVVVHAQKSRKY